MAPQTLEEEPARPAAGPWSTAGVVLDAPARNHYTPIGFDRRTDREMALEKLDLLILKILELAPLHGYGIGQRIEQASGGVFRITVGALYPALQRLERAGLVRASWSVSENNRRARYYSLTPKGRRRLLSRQRAWERTVVAMMRVLHAEGG